MCRLPTIVLAMGAVLLGLRVGAQTYTTDPTLLSRPMADDDIPIIEPRGLSLYDTIYLADALVPTITIEPRGNLAYDARFEFKNTSAEARPIGRLNMGILALGERVRVYDHNTLSEMRDYHYDSFIGTGWRYPDQAYSPAMVVMNETHVIGVSLLYPILEYKHDALVRLAKMGGIYRGPPESRGWMVSFDLSNAPGNSAYTQLPYEALVQPGESRSYTVAVRAMKRPSVEAPPLGRQEWLSVLEPYRDYFRALYGAVGYERRTAPVHGRELANVGRQHLQNVRGLAGGDIRPDRVGFAPIADEIARQNLGYDNVMLWAPSGVFMTNKHLNYPSRFTAGWLDLPKLRTATDSIGLPRIPQSGKELGLWWGRAAEYMDRWEDNASDPLDPDNPVHMQYVHLQMDLATQAGATMIGLDAFTHDQMPVWKQIPYLAHLRQRYPGVSFITEQMSSDVVHVVAPTFNRDFQANDTMHREEDFHRMNRPHYLADYVVPGHETWAYWRYSEIKNFTDATLDSARLQRDAEYIARNGFVPAIVSELRLNDASSANADATWLTTVPGGSDPNAPGNGDDDDDTSGNRDDGGSGEDQNAPNRGGDSGDNTTDPDGKSDQPRVYYITLPSGKRIKITTGK